ncbi:ubiquinol-cytochrome C chaperone-domain-containing protein [Gorgonomyces haynaldii]|nr:ubiquinol-cytochrome C chaperone-domain-containing protein [Gorgonomyces haynaldii]
MEYPDHVSKIMDPVGYVKWKMLLIDVARESYEKCSFQFENKKPQLQEWGLDLNFQTWFNFTVLHVWLVSSRLRTEGKLGHELQQEIFNHIWLDVEIKLHQAGVKTRINKITDNLIGSYYGQTLAYDEGLKKGKPVLASALWRNLYAAQQMDLVKIKSMVEYTEAHLEMLNKLEPVQVLNREFTF